MTTELFDAVSARLKAIFTAHAALELEAEVIARHIQRKATLLKQAATLESDGLKDLAAELRQHAGGLDSRRPAETVLPLLTPTPTTTLASNAQTPKVNGIAVPTTEPAVKGPAPVPAPAPIADDPPPSVDEAANAPTPDAAPCVPPEPAAVLDNPTPDAGNGRSPTRKKSR